MGFVFTRTDDIKFHVKRLEIKINDKTMLIKNNIFPVPNKKYTYN
jgi:hypothetical protein